MPSTPIIWPLRAWFFVELFFGTAASLSVGLRPAETASNFAWTVKPPVMAAMFGGFYMALVPVVILLLFARRWQMVRVFVLPGVVFTFTLLIVTFWHWDRFAIGTAAFNIWFASYLLPPPVLLGCYLWQQRRAAKVTPEVPLARWQLLAATSLGLLFTLEAVIGLFHPAWFGDWAPWKITPLNGRALSAYFLLPGLLLLSIARENDRDRVRILSPFLVLLLPLIAIQLLRFSTEVDWTHPRIYFTAVLLGLVMLLGISLFMGSWRKTLGREH